LKLQRAAPKELRKEVTLCENHLKGCRYYKDVANAAVGGESSAGTPAIANTTTQSPEHTLVQQYKESANEAKKEWERLQLANAEFNKKLRKCQEKLRVNEMFSMHDETKIENLKKEKAQLEEINRMLKGDSDDESTNDLEIGEL
jgi:hypothetical protein